MTDNPTLPADIGGRMLADRTARGLSRSKYAELIGLTTAKVSNLEKGRTPKAEEIPHLQHLAFVEPIASTMGVPNPAPEPQLQPTPEQPSVTSLVGQGDIEAAAYEADIEARRLELIGTYNATVARLDGKPSMIAYHMAWGTPDVASQAMWPRILTWCADVNEWLDGLDLTEGLAAGIESGLSVVAASAQDVIALTRGPAADLVIVDEPLPEDEESEEDLAVVTDVPWSFPDDGIRRISNGQLKTFKECRRKYWLAYYRKLGLAARQATGAAPLGTRVHRCLAVWYVPDGQDRGDPLAELERTFQEDLVLVAGDEIKTKELVKEVDLARAMLEGYLSWLAETGVDEGLRVIAPETKVEVDARMPQGGVNLIAKLDVRVERTFGHETTRLFMDHKALRHDTPVLTPAGWVPIAELEVGDDIIAADGSVTYVTGVYPQGPVQLYRVTFSDKSFVDTCDEHLWSAKVKHRQGYEIVNTATLRETLVSGSQYRWSVPMVPEGKIDGQTTSVPIPPYTLGVLLGDGSIAHGGAMYSSGDPEIAKYIATETGARVSNRGGIGYTIHSREISKGLTDLGLRLTSPDKFVPTAYLHLPSDDRLELLRGLMDTDGCVRTKTHQVIFVSTSEQLRDDVVYLTRSLGGHATPNDNGPGKYVWEGVTHVCKDVFSASLSFASLNPFKLRRKSNHYAAHRRLPKRIVRSITPMDVDEAVCISVAHPDQLYVVKDFIVTHNTTGSFAESTKMVNFDEQMLQYDLVEFLSYLDAGMAGDEANHVRCEGALYNMLRKVKRTATATPPFYDRVEVRHNEHTLRSYWLRVQGIVNEIEELERKLDAGMDPRQVAYPTPTRDCSWKCEFFHVCTMFDDGSRSEDMLTEYFVTINPLQRYAETAEGKTL